MTYQDKIRKYHRVASGIYRNATGDENLAQVSALNGAQALDLNDRTLTVELAPVVSTIAGKARIFGSNLGTDETYNTANNMTVTIPESSHTVVKNSIFGNPFRIKGILYTVTNLLQLAKPFSIIKQSIAGRSETKTWQPSKYTSPSNYNSLQIKTSEFQVVIDAETRIEIDFLAGYSANMVLTIQDMVDLAQTLSNKTPIKSASK
jgi:hypothetical protein